MSNDTKRWQGMTADEQTVLIRQISGTVNGLQFRVQDLEEAVKGRNHAVHLDANPSYDVYNEKAYYLF